MSAKITAALHEVMSAVGYVQKTGKNAFHGYKYAGEADLLEKLRPAMLKAGLLLIPSVTSVSAIDEHGNTNVVVQYTLAHKDGDVWPEKLLAAGTGNDRNKNGVGDKGTYKAITGANKYLLFKLFQIETGDDPEATEAAPAPPAKTKQTDKQIADALIHAINLADSVQDLMDWMKDDTTMNTFRMLPTKEAEVVRNAWKLKKIELTPARDAAE